MEALLEVYNSTKEPKMKNETHPLAVHELENFVFILVGVIWYNLHFAINMVNKTP